MSATDSAGFSPLVSRSQFHEEFRSALRIFVGRGKRYSYKQAGNGAGIHPRMIECFLAPVGSQEWRDPHPEHIFSLASFLGPAFTSEWLKLAHQGAFHLPDEDLPPPGEIAADAATDTAEIVTRAADGEFCAEDRKALAGAGHRSIERGMRLVAAAS